MNLNSIIKNKNEIISIIVITLYAHFINKFSGNVGILTIDTFGFFDTGQSIIFGKLPIRDYWIFTGFVVDYLEALFLLIFGNNWSSHILHASFINIIASLSFYYFLKKNELNNKISFFYTLCFATLCYPVSGTPFAYLHAFVFSLILLMVFYFALRTGKNKLWFALPFIGLFAFLSMQTPSSYIIFLIIVFSCYHFFINKRFINFKYLVAGILLSLIIILLYLTITNTKLISFLYQYFLFPLSIGEGRISGDTTAYLSLKEQINFKRIFGDFKFIHLFLIPLILITIRNLKLKKKKFILLNLIFIFSTMLFIFNQLLTANQIYIFSLVPLLASIIHINFQDKNIPKYLTILTLVFTVLATYKFHLRYNVDRKFHDLEHVDKTKAVDASILHKNLKGLKWVSKQYPDPTSEIIILKNAIKTIGDDKREKMVITHYHFISTVLRENLNILNRWYLWDNNTHPTKTHKYFDFYKKMANEKLKKDNIEVIYLLGKKMKFNQIKKNFTNLCFESNTIEDHWFSSHSIVKCKNK